ncbi:MAG TPA: transmembrane 220 family protein [Candidatus Limnocylindria bacterium]|nr:transmembrane 220 family protein [Candidatus Limnocylindria bacterium]
MAFRILCGVMAVLYLFSVVVQYNDPDPFQWIALYLSGALLSALAAKGQPRFPWIVPTLIGVVALIWGLSLLPGVWGRVGFGELFQEFEMESALVEQARETTALLFTAGWMGVLAWARMRSRAPAS